MASPKDQQEQQPEATPKVAREPFYAIYQSNFDERIRTEVDRAAGQIKNAYGYCRDVTFRKRSVSDESKTSEDQEPQSKS